MEIPATKWEMIEVASRDSEVVIDIIGKRWDSKTDEFEYQRFTGCSWNANHWRNVEEGWKPTYFMPVPPTPFECNMKAPPKRRR